MQYRHTQFDESVNVTPSNPLQDFITYLISIILLLGVVYYSSYYVVNFAVPYVGSETEQWIWNTSFNEGYVTKNKQLSSVSRAQKQYLQSLLDKIPKTGLPDNHYEVIVEENSSVNAMALPSGKIVVYTGLLNRLKSENAIVFVLGHELGHFAGRDHLRRLGRSLLTSLLLAPILSDSSGASLLGDVGTGFDAHFSREQETAADEHGVIALDAFYGHAGGATEFFKEMGTDEEGSLAFLYASSHPISHDRVAHLERFIIEKHMRTLVTVPKKL